MGGAPLVAFHGLPIVPPGCGLNVTFATVNQDICLAVGAAPEAMDEPYRLTQLVLAAVDRLEKACLPKAKAKAKAKTRTKAGKKAAGKKRAAGGSRKTS